MARTFLSCTLPDPKAKTDSDNWIDICPEQCMIEVFKKTKIIKPTVSAVKRSQTVTLVFISSSLEKKINSSPERSTLYHSDEALFWSKTECVCTARFRTFLSSSESLPSAGEWLNYAPCEDIASDYEQFNSLWLSVRVLHIRLAIAQNEPAK